MIEKVKLSHGAQRKVAENWAAITASALVYADVVSVCGEGYIPVSEIARALDFEFPETFRLRFDRGPNFPYCGIGGINWRRRRDKDGFELKRDDLCEYLERIYLAYQNSENEVAIFENERNREYFFGDSPSQPVSDGFVLSAGTSSASRSLADLKEMLSVFPKSNGYREVKNPDPRYSI